MASDKVFKEVSFFDPFDISRISNSDEEHVLYVQAVLFPFGESDEFEHETWHCMLTTQRIVLCKREDDGRIVTRKQLHYDRIKQLKLKKNKRFKKLNNRVNLPGIKVYLQPLDGTETAEQTTKSSPKSDEYRPLSFKDVESRDLFYHKMVEILDSKTPGGNRENHTLTPPMDVLHEEETVTPQLKANRHELYNSLYHVIEHQTVFNECISMWSAADHDTVHSFDFLGTALSQAVQMTDVDHDKYALKLTRDDIKHVKAYYRSKQDNLQIRNHRVLWFINSYIAAKLFEPHFPLSISSEIQWVWIQQLCRSSIFFMDDKEMNDRCIWLMDTLMKRCFRSKYIKPIDTFFHEKDYQNLQILLHLMKHYVNDHKLDYLPKLRYKHMVPLMVKNRSLNIEYGSYFVELIRIPFLKRHFKETDIYQCILQYIECVKYLETAEDVQQDEVITAMVFILKTKKLSKIWPENALILQEIINTVPDEQLALKRITVSLMLDSRLLQRTFDGSYGGMTPLQFAQRKQGWPNVLRFLRQRVEALEAVTPGASTEDEADSKETNDDDTEFGSDSETQNHEEGGDAVFSSLFGDNLDEKEKEKMKAWASESQGVPKSAPMIRQEVSMTLHFPNMKGMHSLQMSRSEHRDSIVETVGSTKGYQPLDSRRGSEVSRLSSISGQHDSLCMPQPVPEPQPKLMNGGGMATKGGGAKRGSPRRSASVWNISSYFGCLPSFVPDASLSKKSPKNANMHRRMASYVSTMDRFKQKNRSLEQKIVSMKRAISKQNEQILELQLENKMLKNILSENEEKEASSGGRHSRKNSQIDPQVDKALVRSKNWKKWSYVEILYWVGTLKKGRFKKYRQVLRANLKLRNIKGIHLAKVEKSDLSYFYGIVDFDDVCDLYKEITELVDPSSSK